MTPGEPIDPNILRAARDVLTDDQMLTWLMWEEGLSEQAIADYRRTTRWQIRQTLDRVATLIEEDMSGAHPDTHPAPASRTGKESPGGAGTPRS
jgi:hypothetical protein